MLPDYPGRAQDLPAWVFVGPSAWPSAGGTRRPLQTRLSSPPRAPSAVPSMHPEGLRNFLLLAASLLFAGLAAGPPTFSPSLR